MLIGTTASSLLALLRHYQNGSKVAYFVEINTCILIANLGIYLAFRWVAAPFYLPWGMFSYEQQRQFVKHGTRACIIALSMLLVARELVRPMHDETTISLFGFKWG